MNLLTTYELFEPELITEQATEPGAPKKVLMKGILQKAGTLNQNSRVYPKHILERECRNYQKFIIENRAVGELDHPDTSVINLKNVSHIVRELSMDGNVVRGTVEVLNTPSGRTLRDLIEGGVKIGISSRGVGSTQKQGDYHVVQEDFQLIGFDVVSEPSTPGAFLLPEGKRISPEEFRKAFTRSDRIDRILNEILYNSTVTG